MITIRNYQDSDEEIVKKFFIKYYHQNPLAMPFLLCNYEWGLLLTEFQFIHQQFLFFDDNVLIGLITFDGHPGEDFIYLNKGYEYLFDKALEYCEKELYHINEKGEKELSFRFNVLNQDLKQRLINHHYICWWEDVDSYLLTSDDFPAPTLPKGFHFKKMNEENIDLLKLGKAVYFGFNNDPDKFDEKHELEWYQSLGKFKDYDTSKSIIIVNDQNEYCSYAHFWIQEDYCILEPLCTRKEFQCLGLGKAMLEYGFLLAKENHCHFFRGGPMEFYVKQGMKAFKGYTFGKTVK